MAKVVLVWNEHPTEVVAGFHARKVARILREKYGHEVVVEKNAVTETTYGALYKNDVNETARTLENFSTSGEIAISAAMRYNAPAFNFHASTFRYLGQAEEKKPSRFKVGEHVDDLAATLSFMAGLRHWSEIELFRQKKSNSYVVEVPSFEVELPAKIRKKLREKLDRAARTGDFVPALTDEIARHISNYNPLWHPSQQKYLHPAISEKIAAAIHKRISGQSSR